MPRYTIDFDDKFDKTLNDLLQTTDATTKADVIRRAVASYSYLKNEQRENQGARLASRNRWRESEERDCFVLMAQEERISPNEILAAAGAEKPVTGGTFL